MELKGKEKRILLSPAYYKSFVCDGRVCEDCCCVGSWNIFVDKASYLKMQSIKEPEIAQQIQKYVTKLPANNSGQYAQLKQDAEKSRCVFLTDQKLCGMQIQYGAEYLCDVCVSYPREMNLVNHVVEVSLSPSCPIAARLVLLNDSIMEFEETVEPEGARYITAREINCWAKEYTGTHVQYFWEMRAFTIDVLQSRTYSLQERLLALGLFYQKVQQNEEKGTPQKIPNIIEFYAKKLIEGEFKGCMDAISAYPTLQMDLLKEIVDERVSTARIDNSYARSLFEFLNGIHYTGDARKGDIVNNYINAHKLYYSPLIEKHEYILENYLVNNVFKNLFPVFGGNQLFDSYVMLIINYALIKMHLIGIAGYYKEEFSIDNIIRFIQVYVRTIEHSPDFVNHIYKLLKKNHFTSLGYMAILIKN